MLNGAADSFVICPDQTRFTAVKTFENFALDLPPANDLDEYDAVVIWREAFEQFFTVARLEN